jgi:hypothetical protein
LVVTITVGFFLFSWRKEEEKKKEFAPKLFSVSLPHTGPPDGMAKVALRVLHGDDKVGRLH